MANFNDDDYGLDNEGSSFGYSNTSLDDLLNESNTYAMNDDVNENNASGHNTQNQDYPEYQVDNTPQYNNNNGGVQYSEPEYEKPQRAPEPVHEEPAPRKPVQYSEPEYEKTQRAPEPVHEEPAPRKPVQYSEPEYEKPQRAPEPVPTHSNKTNNTGNPISFSSKEEKIEQYSLVIKILDNYRQLKNEEKHNAQAFFNAGKPCESEAEFVYHVLNSDQEMNKGILNLSQAKELDPTERSFFVIYLTDQELSKISTILNIFGIKTDASGTGDERHRNLSLSIVKAVDKIGEEHLNFLKIIGKLLKVTE